MRRKCKARRYTKHFTKAVPLEELADAGEVNARSLVRVCERSNRAYEERYVVRADERLTAFLELERAV